MENRSLAPEYLFDVEKGIWARTGYAGIQYNDGDATEQRIATIIHNASDISVFSPELRTHCTDWPSLYHLSSTRANILRPFAAELCGDILEIGAGCGAVTRYLGESGANILALEGSPRRAAITRSRTRDLENVTVLAEKFDQFECGHRFDLITLIGVLEYANLFTSGENPALRMLQRVRSLLKPDGNLIVAIENQVGLKYFAGAPEDHLGQPMYGIEGRYTENQPQTFGRAVLLKLMEEAGFVMVEFLAPFPDYKLPVSILTEEGISSRTFDGAALAWQSVRRDPQLPSITNFSLELAWPEVFKNGLALDMANSFLIAASPLQKKIVKPGVLGYHYSTDRAIHYCKETIFERLADNVLIVDYRMLGRPEDKTPPDEIIAFEQPKKTVYTRGKPFSFEFVRIVTCERWTIDEVGVFIQRYIKLLILIVNQKGELVALSQLSDKLPGNFFDATPQNIIINSSGEPVAIDTEWSLKGEIELGFLLFRSLLLSIGSVSFSESSTGEILSGNTFIKLAMYAAGYSATDDDIARFTELESLIQQQVTGRSVKDALNWWLEQPLPTCDRSAAKCVEQIARLNHGMAERDGRIAALQRHIIDIHTSTSWRLTTPIRSIKLAFVAFDEQLRQGKLTALMRSSRFNKILRQLYRSVPLPWPIKHRLKEIYLRRPGAWKTGIKGIHSESSREALPLVVASAKQFCSSDPWVLVVDLRIPTPDQDSGSVRMSAILRLLQEMRFRITFISDSEEYLPHYQEVLEKQGIVVLHGVRAAHRHLAEAGGKYHFVLLSRPEVAFGYLPYVRAYAVYSNVIYDMVDLHWLRYQREMQLSGDRNLGDVVEHFRRIELFNTANADLVLAITDEERDLLLIEQPNADVEVLPNIHEIYPPRTHFTQRKGLLFIGGFWHTPNEDAVIYFVKDILPRITEELPDIVFYIIGSNMPGSVRSLNSANVKPLGFVPDVAPYFESCRVFVAPLRFGAGMKGKVGQSVSHGLPVVTTQIGAEGMGLQDEKHLLVADNPQDFADRVVRLYRDEILWHRLSTAGLAHLEARYSSESARKRMVKIFRRTQGESPQEVGQGDQSITLPPDSAQCSTDNSQRSA